MGNSWKSSQANTSDEEYRRPGDPRSHSGETCGGKDGEKEGRLDGNEEERRWPDDECEDLAPENEEASGGRYVRPHRTTCSPELREDNCPDEGDDDEILATVESNTSLKESRVAFLKALHGPPMTFRLVLDCKGTKTVEEKELTVEGNVLTENIQKLKLCIEHHHSVPASIQTVTFDCCTLEDQHPLSYYHLREGDCLRVAFERTGDLAEIMEIIDSMKVTYVLLKSLEHDIRKGTLKESTLQQIHRKVCSEEVESLPEVYFASSMDKAEINRIFFVDCGGVVMFHKLHEQLLKHPWCYLPLRLQALERAILRSFWNLTADFSVRTSVLHKSRALQNIMKSFLRIKIESYNHIKAPLSMYNDSLRYDRRNWDYSAVNVAFKSMGALCNLAEIPECHMKIASNKAVLKQLIAIMSCHDFREIAAMISMGGMLCLSYSASTHKYLAHTSIVNGILKHCNGSMLHSCRDHSKLAEYFAIIMYAIVLTTSPHLVSLGAKLHILDFNKTFYEEADYMEIRQEEIKNGFKWSTLIPYMKLAYHAHEHPDKDLAYNEREYFEEMKTLNRYCIKSGIFSMANLLQCPTTRDIFLQEGLMDYLVCLPWLYSQDWPERRQAQQLVAFMGQHVQLQPPSLINITKAQLAATYFGLERVLSTDSVHQLLAEVYV